jgi:hypothetical protein
MAETASHKQSDGTTLRLLHHQAAAAAAIILHSRSHGTFQWGTHYPKT